MNIMTLLIVDIKYMDECCDNCCAILNDGILVIPRDNEKVLIELNIPYKTRVVKL